MPLTAIIMLFCWEDNSRDADRHDSWRRWDIETTGRLHMMGKDLKESCIIWFKS